MFQLFKKAFWVPYEDSSNYPTVEKAHRAITNYCEENGLTFSFMDAHTVVIAGREYEIFRGYETGSRGNYGIKCREK